MKFHSKVIGFFFFLLGFLFFGYTPLYGQPVILFGNQEIESLGSSLSYFVDTENKNYTIDEIRNENLGIKWQSNASDHLNLGYLNSPLWLRFEVHNQSDIEDWQMILENPITFDLIFYHDAKGSLVDRIRTGILHPYDSRGDIKDGNFVFPLKLRAGDTATYYFQIYSQSPSFYPISILRKSKVLQESMNRHIGYGIYFGILLVMILYNLVIFIMTKDLNYLYYIFTIFCTFLIFAGIAGYLFKYIYPDLAINANIVIISMSGIVITTSIFTIHFLDLRKRHIWFYRHFLLMILLVVFAFLYNYLTHTRGAVNSVMKLQSISLISVGIYSWYKGNKYARFFIVAWSAYVVGGLLITFRNSGMLPVNFLTSYAVYIGSALETILISVALADRYNTIRREKDRAVQKAFALEKQTQAELEQKVKIRTQKLHESNEELSITLKMVKEQKTEIEEKNNNISSSLNYAQRIQGSILPSDRQVADSFADSFVFYLPRDVVSGDFYFHYVRENHTFLVVADCTGHGVPGALMSMIGINILHRIMLENSVKLPAEILLKLHQEVVSVLHQKDTGNSDGMDISLCMIDSSTQKICFSGAKNPLVRICDQEITVYKGSKFSVGGSLKTKGIHFENEWLDIDEGAYYYMFSDGYQDQFGGAHNRKFMRKHLRELLQSIHQLSGAEQRKILAQRLEDWIHQANTEQTDDILVMGFKP